MLNAMCAAIYTSGTSFQCVVKNALNMLASTVRRAILFDILPAEALYNISTIVSGLLGLPSWDGATPCSGGRYKVCFGILSVWKLWKLHMDSNHMDMLQL
jgi:hypothetical protein